ncbi:BZ3500_MvSof-1268-A1-R1_Chr4-3g07228 [Microbotryum saponariae]|uniref:BZ3500_MvSof-1268-A1-R1_Chr4-3g07228 protein n=1 Tax=Microbotryum saponariae TaxID=289078 RepID=A0A2X0KUB5_9BASI|nr:BZ3500_MvSof-1268-A1-R1_Chr4-3g07228 [Microbotryum saponariae]SDA06891.1 BZ3501_MvSof-1269-A2-R1_Chr4-2g06937 [Microbotryum saponariae]
MPPATHRLRRWLPWLSTTAADYRLVSRHTFRLQHLATRSSSSRPAGVSATSVFYRKLAPSMLHCLALGSIVCYGLELLHSHLHGQYLAKELQARVDELKIDIEQVLSSHVEMSSTGALDTNVNPPHPQRTGRWWQFGRDG